MTSGSGSSSSTLNFSPGVSGAFKGFLKFQGCCVGGLLLTRRFGRTRLDFLLPSVMSILMTAVVLKEGWPRSRACTTSDQVQSLCLVMFWMMAMDLILTLLQCPCFCKTAEPPRCLSFPRLSRGARA
ncbi:hypothetical protein EYF80_008940 [Liparis tanakae]|uniref:Uncharacterized protein n=1 Tax=Liparis tanakae TaxID=230148 RepID=A0A4Z2ISQ5_9TELE|nr:hypothetical protein EYF80_008940 [Liparis tanakae]